MYVDDAAFVDWDSVPEATWAKTQLLYVCSPGNPTGAVMPLDEWRKLFALQDRHGFVIASDECYSEIYFRDEPPLGGLEAAVQLGRTDFRGLVAFTSLSKRSNVPGMRSGFVAGDSSLIRKFLLYRTYHGCAMPVQTQLASIAAWNDEVHVRANRALYREKFDAVLEILSPVLDVQRPDGSFYLWPNVAGDDAALTRANTVLNERVVQAATALATAEGIAKAALLREETARGSSDASRR